MDTPLQSGRAVRYACAVLADCRIGTLPVDPFDLSARASMSSVMALEILPFPSSKGCRVINHK